MCDVALGRSPPHERSQALIRNAILTHGTGFLEIALRIRFFLRFANVLIANGETTVDELARGQVRALILAIALRAALRRSRARFIRSAARNRRWIRNASAIRVITDLPRGTIGIGQTKDLANAADTCLSRLTLRIGRALRIRRIRNTVSIDAFFARTTRRLIATADFAFPVDTNFTASAFEAVVAANDAQAIDTQ